MDRAARSAASEARGQFDLSEPNPSHEKHASREAHRMITRLGLSWKMPITELEFPLAGGESLPVHYLSPIDVFTFLLNNHPEVIFGGFHEPHQWSMLLNSWWQAFQSVQPSHVVYTEHKDSLNTTIPLILYGDEGRGRRRGNTAVCSIEVPFGLHTGRNAKSLSEHALDCSSCRPTNPPNTWPVTRDTGGYMTTNLKEHSFLSRFLLWIQPCVNYNAHPSLIPWLLQRIALDLRRLFYEGIQVGNRSYCFALVGFKGDQKWHAQIAYFDRYYGRKGRKKSLACCFECMAGLPGMPYEDCNATAAWTATVYSARPWSIPPPMALCPFEPDTPQGKPEMLYKKDPFHILKLGLFRHYIGSVLVTLVQWNQFWVANESNAAPVQLNRAFSYFRMWCLAFRKTAALRSFSRNLLNWPNTKTYPFANVKASDSMLLVSWLVSMLPAVLRQDDYSDADKVRLKVMLDVGQAAIDFYKLAHGHGLLLARSCAAAMYEAGRTFLNGYCFFAHENLKDDFNAFGIIPKCHSFQHILHELHTFLQSEGDLYINNLVWSCDMGEDLIGKVCRLSRRADARQVTKRVLQLYLIKCRLLWNRVTPRVVV